MRRTLSQLCKILFFRPGRMNSLVQFPSWPQPAEGAVADALAERVERRDMTHSSKHACPLCMWHSSFRKLCADFKRSTGSRIDMNVSTPSFCLQQFDELDAGVGATARQREDQCSRMRSLNIYIVRKGTAVYRTFPCFS